MSKSPSSFRRKLLVLAGAFLFAFVIGEVLVRILVGSPLAERLPILEIQANRYRGWQMVPGEMHYTYHHPVQVNAFGLRGPELGEKQPNEVRVLALGDSLVYGQGVGDDETIPYYLEHFLDGDETSGRDWVAINAGHRSYDTHQELELLRELGSALQPDVVIVFWFWNDIFERDIDRTYNNLEHKGRVTFDTAERMEGMARLRWQAVQLVRRSALVMYAYDVLRGLRAGEVFDEATVDGALLRLDSYLADFHQLADELDFDLVFATIPDPNALLGVVPGQEVEDAVVARVEAAGIPVLRMNAPLERVLEEEGRLPVIPYDGHYLPEANRAMARYVASALQDRGIGSD